ncbi:Membrane-bound lytic murein transglycosylase F [Corynebacterium faecale]|uniref:transporter substrate-binding domain-containing protein n=1 Tax=Corynebacterium faecale TaxID=1758466 RepID=UPI0025B406C1|nr:ABC transporter substrate-binding protein [Corynebacterium faecale]WJY93270.1 Membrane-bound lytic murein transglycosylase F [Corynebacterium faecale]
MTPHLLLRKATPLGAVALLLGACSTIPADAEGTFSRAENGTLVVGVSEHHPWTVISDEGDISGSEVDLIVGFADSINAQIEWQQGPESILAERIKEGEVDVIIGGLTDSSPWSSHMALTRPYAEVDGEKMVMGARLGENQFLVELERHLAEDAGESGETP